MQNYKSNAVVEWTQEQVEQLLKTYPHLTDMEIARRSGWTVWRVQEQFGWR